MAEVLIDEAPPPPLTGEEERLEDLRAVLWKMHGVTVGKDDPVLMMHTINRVAVQDFERMLDATTRRFHDVANEVAEDLSRDVSRMIEDVKAKALNDAIRERLATVREAAEMAEQAQAAFKKTKRSLAVIAGVSMFSAALVLGVLAYLTV